ALEGISRSRYVSPLFKYDVERAVRTAFSQMADASEKGFSLSEQDQLLRVAANPDLLAKALKDDPQAANLLLAGPKGLAGALEAVFNTYDENTASVIPFPDASAANPSPGVALAAKKETELTHSTAARLDMVLQSIRVPPSDQPGVLSSPRPGSISGNGT